jgi:hypothetical protein
MTSQSSTRTRQLSTLHQVRASTLHRNIALFVLLLLVGASVFAAQNVPVISGGLGFLEGKNDGAYQFQPVVAPQFTSPIGRDLLFESRFYFGEGIARQDGTTGPYQGTFFKSTQYLQLDYIASPHLTFVAGRFLTPFGTYNERLSPIWIQNLQDSPLIVPIGDPDGSSDGAMVRGVVFSKPSVQVNYLGFFSAPTNNSQFLSSRQAGERIDVYFPGKRVEIGSSYVRLLQGTQTNSIGTHFWWEPWRFPLHVRSEYAHGPHAQGYWIESAYRLSQWRGEDSLVGRLEPVFRMQQTFRDSPGAGDGLPSTNTQQADFGFVYHLPHETRFGSSYARKFSSTGNANIWNMSLTYRFLFPAWRGHQ